MREKDQLSPERMETQVTTLLNFYQRKKLFTKQELLTLKNQSVENICKKALKTALEQARPILIYQILINEGQTGGVLAEDVCLTIHSVEAEKLLNLIESGHLEKVENEKYFFRFGDEVLKIVIKQILNYFYEKKYKLLEADRFRTETFDQLGDLCRESLKIGKNYDHPLDLYQKLLDECVNFKVSNKSNVSAFRLEMQEIVKKNSSFGFL